LVEAADWPILTSGAQGYSLRVVILTSAVESPDSVEVGVLQVAAVAADHD